MKKRIAILLLIALLLTGCTGPDTTAPTQDTEAAVTTSPSQTTQPTTQPTQPEPTEPEPTEPEPTCGGHESDPYVDVDVDAFYANYTTACCYVDACYRTEHYLMSGSLEVPGQYATISSYQPTDDRGTLAHNTDAIYLDDGNTYVVVDAYGYEMMRIYKGAAYITLEEVAAYMYAFGGSVRNIPANYVSSKPTKVNDNPWGIYLRGNHSNFSGSTSKYPYEPELPDITGCGGDLTYYEMDIGTTGTDTGNGYEVAPYNNGTKITRGAARLVYTRMDKNGNGTYENDEIYVFYTCNHYNDFREYLNYYGGWGEIFGNETGGGTLSSKTDYNPTPYVHTAYLSFSKLYNRGE